MLLSTLVHKSTLLIGVWGAPFFKLHLDSAEPRRICNFLQILEKAGKTLFMHQQLFHLSV